MTKFWMVTITILALGSMTGCPDDSEGCPGCNVCGDGYCDLPECDSCPEDCNPEVMVFCEGDAGTDADADSDTTDDGTTDETASCPTCPNVAGEWLLTYYSNETHVQWINSLHLDQDGINVTGYDEDCEYSGIVSEDGTLSLTGDCPPKIFSVTADASAYFFLDGTFSVVGTTATGTWQADRQ